MKLLRLTSIIHFNYFCCIKVFMQMTTQTIMNPGDSEVLASNVYPESENNFKSRKSLDRIWAYALLRATCAIQYMKASHWLQQVEPAQ